MKNNVKYYSVGALLYCPANQLNLADSIINDSFGTQFSLALCLEDTINDDYVDEAEEILLNSVNKIYSALQTKNFYLPKIFIRVRNPKQIVKLTKALGTAIEIISGYIIPKFNMDNAHPYMEAITTANSLVEKTLYMMPIYENSSIINLKDRITILYNLKDQLKNIEDYILNIRVGGNDLCHMFGFRRHSNESIHDIKPISNIFSDIITIYGMDYVISGPVWEYYSGKNWQTGLYQEIAGDQLCGFIGKTIIHPNQIKIVNDAYKITKQDFNDAQSILSWNKNSNSFVSGNVSRERMNEYKTHTNWAQKTIYLAEAFGIKE